MKYFSGFILVLAVLLACFVCAFGRPQSQRKEINREQADKYEDLESGAEEDLKTAASSYGYGYQGGYYPSYSYRRYNPFYPSFGYYGSVSPYYTSSYHGLGGLYGGLYY